MPNPLFNAIMGGSQPGKQQGGEIPQQAQGTPQNAPQGQRITMQDAMAQLKSDPAGMLRQAGYNVPDELANNPQAAVMHILQSGQVKNPLYQMIQPMLNRLMGGRR